MDDLNRASSTTLVAQQVENHQCMRRGFKSCQRKSCPRSCVVFFCFFLSIDSCICSNNITVFEKKVSSYCISIPSAMNMGMELSIGIFTSTLLRNLMYI